jgi:hypothetical protein
MTKQTNSDGETLNHSPKVKLSKRIQNQENYYLQMPEDSSIYITDGEGYILGSVIMKNGFPLVSNMRASPSVKRGLK